MLRAITFDATGTLFHSPRLGRIYSEVLGRHGVEIEARRVEQLVRRVWQEFDCATPMGVDRFSVEQGGARAWWARFLERLCEHAEAPRPSRFAAVELYDRFARADSWELFPDVVATLEELCAGEVELAVVSNWDERLPHLLEELGIARYFSEVVFSAEAGFEKPHPGIFESALARLSLEPEEVLHVGDSRRLDVEGAQAIGMRAVHLGRSGGGEICELAELRGAAERLWYLANEAT